MCRMASWATRRPGTARDALGDAAIARFRLLSTVHEDGWGAAWIDDAGALRTHHSVLPAHQDPGFAELVDGEITRAGMIHARLGTPGYGEGAVNVHPFEGEGRAFVHNGALLPTERIGGLLPAGAPVPRGQTDSEIYFLALRHELGSGDDLAAAVDRVIDRVEAAGLHASSMNAFLLDERALAVISHYDPAAGTGGTRVWPDEGDAAGIEWPAYHPMLATERDDLVAVVSSGLIDDPAAHGWSVLGNDQLWRIDVADLTLRRSTLHPARASA